MRDLQPGKLHVTFLGTKPVPESLLPRKYTLTHSDLTGELFLTVGREYNRKQIAGIYTRLMRDEVLAEWKHEGAQHSLHVYCHVSGGLALGRAKWRNAILRKHMRMVIEALRYGDRDLLSTNFAIEEARVQVHFRSLNPDYDRVEDWGALGSYR
jgi:hypothetical protein